LSYWAPVLSEYGKIQDKDKVLLSGLDIEFEEGGHDEFKIKNADIIIKSPGIPPTAQPLTWINKEYTKVISEIEFASYYTKATLIGITGTNGKTTTTLLTYHILKSAGLNVGIAGNVGESFALQVATKNYDYYVLELSSFQLDDCHDLHLHISCILNITEDHLDRYNGSMNKYIESKLRITQNQTHEDYFIYCSEDSNIDWGINNTQVAAKLLTFGLKDNDSASASKNEIEINLENNQYTIDMNNLQIRGKHNTYNTMAAAIMSSLLDVRKDNIRESLTHFQNVEHRLENLGKVYGVEYINDSKATNVNSTWYALESMEKPIIWIAGGVDKGNDYSSIKPLVKEKVKLIVCLGLDNRKIHQAFQSDVDMIINTSSAKEAVHVASRMASNGDAVLLSPACASFDLFENYEERGRLFKQAVKNL
jgi:UDP-N-acetylmuramoylalanine--D-glutamate ligase